MHDRLTLEQTRFLSGDQYLYVGRSYTSTFLVARVKINQESIETGRLSILLANFFNLCLTPDAKTNYFTYPSAESTAPEPYPSPVIRAKKLS